jgi:hypothetical protein
MGQMNGMYNISNSLMQVNNLLNNFQQHSFKQEGKSGKQPVAGNPGQNM